MSKTSMRKIPAAMKDYLPTRAAYDYAVELGLDYSLPWFKSMVWKNRIASIDLGGRKFIHKDEIARIVKNPPKLHLTDLVSKVA